MLQKDETAINLKIATRQRLKAKITKVETYDSYINKLLDFYEKSQSGELKC